MGFKCRDCRICVHPDCRCMVTIACVPQSVGTPTPKGGKGGGPGGVGGLSIGDYAPSTSPMVPAIIVHCINEIEIRGLNEIGIYRVSGSEKDIKALKVCLSSYCIFIILT